MDGDDDETWEEFGYQLRSGPALTATPTTNAGQSQVELDWTEVPLSSEWTPAPSVSYTVTREDDDTIDTIAENLTVREYTDTDVAGETYIYQVVANDRIGGLAGSNGGEVTAAYATGRVVGDSEAGGLIGGNTGDVTISYATGLVSGRSTVGGLVGRNSGGGTITDSYWDSDTSGRTTGSYGQAKDTAELQLPTDYSDIYQTWNVDLDGDSMNDDPWDFGTSSQYPVLAVDTNGVGGATWQEFGQQVRTRPALMPTTALGQVTLTWSEVSSATYNLYRTAGTTVELLSENTSSRSYVDTDVTAGATYIK